MKAPTPRSVCPRCRRPTAECWCSQLTPVHTSTRVVLLQHPRESKVAIGTARMAHLGLANSELHEGIDFSSHARVQELIAAPGTAVLFPGEGALAPETLAHAPTTLMVIDGTWPQARKLFALNPALQKLPRIGFVPRTPGNYRIRREPADHCMATIEAVVEVLALLERDDQKFAPLIRTFNQMIDRQIAHAATRTEPVRRNLTPPEPWWHSPAMPNLVELWPHLVAVVAEANAHGRDSGIPGAPELIQLTAVRLSTGELFNSFAIPRRPLAPRAPIHLGIPAEQFLAAPSIQESLQKWDRFLGPNDHLLGWGNYPRDLLAQESWHSPNEWIDLRSVMTHRLKHGPGSVGTAAQALGATASVAPDAPGRAGRTLRDLARCAMVLRDEAAAGR